MPRLAEQESHIITTSVGGSVFRPERINISFTRRFIEFCRPLLSEGKTVIAVIGGGMIARYAIEDARSLGVAHEPTLDQIGVYVTKENALILTKILEANGLHAHLYHRGDFLERGIIYLEGGSEPGHTTDFVAIEAAREAGLSLLLNISNVNGLHPVRNGQIDTETVIPSIPWQEYLEMFPEPHHPGRSAPFDPEAGKLARKYGMTVVLVGPDFDNLDRCLVGEEFVGTLIHP